MDALEEIAAVLTASLERIAELEDALRRHGRHLPDCESLVFDFINNRPYKCDCGLAEALGEPSNQDSEAVE